jgi:large subunit ribosomal protein L25
MERVPLNAQTREETGKKSTKALRKENLVPAVVYKEGKKTVHLRINERDLYNALHTKAGENALINLKVEDKAKGKDKDRVVIIKEIQQHPIRAQVLHVDFQEISLTEELEVDVPIAVKGEAEGVVKDEGVLEHVMWEVKVACLPTDIPEKIEIDVTQMKIGDSVLIKDLEVPPGVKILADAEQTVISVVPQHVEEVAPAPEEEITEPELIREKKEEEEVEEGAEEAAPKEKKEAKPEDKKQDKGEKK